VFVACLLRADVYSCTVCFNHLS